MADATAVPLPGLLNFESMRPAWRGGRERAERVASSNHGPQLGSREEAGGLRSIPRVHLQAPSCDFPLAPTPTPHKLMQPSACVSQVGILRDCLGGPHQRHP
eukprot:352312-Chlamydomonas_euryale.AAC.1